MCYKYTVNNVYAFLLLNKLKQCTTKLLNISSTKKEQPFIQKKNYYFLFFISGTARGTEVNSLLDVISEWGGE